MKYKLLDIVKAEDKNYKPSEFFGEIVSTKEGDVTPYYFSSFDGKHSAWCKEEELTPIEKNFFSIQVGDIVVDKHGSEKKVLEVGETSFLTSDWGNFERAGASYTKAEAEKAGWKIKGKEEEDEVIEIKMSKKKANELNLL